MTTVEEISELTRPHHPDDWTELDSAAVDTVRVLAADAVQKVGNGHPGTAMSLAPARSPMTTSSSASTKPATTAGSRSNTDHRPRPRPAWVG